MTPFSNVPVEITLLASMLEHPDAYHQAMALGLAPECFSVELNRVLFRAITQLGEAGLPISYETVLSELGKRPGGEKFFPVLEDLTNPLHLPRTNVEWHVAQLKDVAKRSRFHALSKRAQAAAEDPAEKTNDCVNEFEQAITEIQSDPISAKPTLLKEFMGGVIREIQAQALCTGVIGLQTGIPELDKATTGIRPGELWVVGAPTGGGKTVLGTQLAVASAKGGHSAAIFSLEMTQEELGTRLLASESTVSASRFRNPSYISKAHWKEIAACTEQLCELPIHVDVTPSPTIQEIVARARRFVRQHQCRLIVVDYIRLIKAPGKELREQVGNATDALRQLAKVEKVGVIALSQLARPTGKNVNSRPTMYRLEESGDVEAHAHVVLLIHMPMTKTGWPTGEDEIIIAKNRHGPIGTIKVTFDRDRLKFLPRDDAEKETIATDTLFKGNAQEEARDAKEQDA